MKKVPYIHSSKEKLLGLDQTITRRDFLNAGLLGAGSTLMYSLAPGIATANSSAHHLAPDPDWYGYGGIGDYASSHGNTPEIVAVAHHIRDQQFAGPFPHPSDIEEEYDLVIVGGGMAGLGAAWHFKKHAKPGQKCLMLDNHPIFGGEAKENEFAVNGVGMTAPQGSNGFFMPPVVDDPEQASGDARYYAEFNIPRELSYRQWNNDEKELAFCRDNYGFLYWMLQEQTSTGHYFNNKNNSGTWAKNIWKHKLENTPLSKQTQSALLAWRNSRSDSLQDEAALRWLDTMSYKDYLEKELKLGPEGSAYADVFLAGAYGLGSDAVSAYAAREVLMPGTLTEEQFTNKLRRNSFPGGNSGFARYFLKAIIPEAIAGAGTFDDIITGRINFTNLDRADQTVGIRLDSTAASIKHEGNIDNAESVKVVYHNKNKLHAIRAKSVVMASGGWMNRHVVKDLPSNYQEAYTHFHHVPFLVINVALTNWRFLYRLGLTACVWDEGFGYSCNIRQPMMVGKHQAPLDPDLPVVLTFYVPFHSPGLPVKTQGMKGRTEMLFTSYSEYERKIREQMAAMFSSAGFNPKKDIAGIILNRWGHAFVVPTPGFFFDRENKLAPRNVIRQRYGRIAFGHSELQGLQHWGPAADEGRRAVEQILEII